MIKRMIVMLLMYMLLAPHITYAKTSPALTVPKVQLIAQGIRVPTKLYTENNMNLLAKLLMAENGSAVHDETLYLTGVVVLKRVESKRFPNTIKEVIYQKGQYSTADRIDSVVPDERCLEIAEELLINGVDIYSDNLVYQSMFPQGREIYKVIDGEYFCLSK